MALGAPRLGFSLHLRAHRLDPADAEALYYRARAVLALRGPYAAWRFMRERELPERAAVEVRADWLALQATVATGFRDFETAELRLGEAEALCPERPWIAVERTAVLEEQDRLEEALARISATLRESPLFRPGIGASARLLERLGRFEEAVALLRRADAELETGSLAAHLAQILIDLDRPQEALAALDRFAMLSPLLEGHGKAWLAARRSDAAYALGDYETARREAEAAANPFHAEIARRLAAPPVPAPARVLLGVPFIQQQHLTCSPTALASLTSYWRRPVDHVDARPEDRLRRHAGLPRARVGPSQRVARPRVPPAPETRRTSCWAEASRSRSRRSTPPPDTRRRWPAAIPLRGTLLVRDPSLPRLVEMLLEPLLEQQASHGPRCLALLPARDAAAPEVPELPDEREYDELHALELALQRHDRARAQAIRDALHERAPAHLLSLFMDARLLAYDDDLEALLPVYDALAARFPDNELYALRRVSLLLQLGRRDDAIALLSPRAQRSGVRSGLRDAARGGAGGGRTGGTGGTAAARALAAAAARRRPGALGPRGPRLRPRRPRGGVRALPPGGVRGHPQRGARRPLREHGAGARPRRGGRRLPARARGPARGPLVGPGAQPVPRPRGPGPHRRGPGRARGGARPPPGRRRPAAVRRRGPGPLRPPGAGARAAGRGRAARRERATGGAPRRASRAGRATWARASQAWSAVAATEPLALDAHRAVAELRSRLEGRPRAIEHVAAASARVPTHLGLRRLLVEWLRDDPARAEDAVRALARAPPDGRLGAPRARARARRTSALRGGARGARARRRAGAGAGGDARRARAGAGAGGPRSRGGAVLPRGGRARRRLPLGGRGPDRRVPGARGQAARRCASSRASSCGSGPPTAYFTFQRRSHGILEPSETLRALETARAAHPDLWQPPPRWRTSSPRRAASRKRRASCEEATRRFPLVAPLWLDRARVSGRQGDAEREVAFLEKAIALSPGWTVPLNRLAEALMRHGALRRGGLAAAAGGGPRADRLGPAGAPGRRAQERGRDGRGPAGARTDRGARSRARVGLERPARASGTRRRWRASRERSPRTDPGTPRLSSPWPGRSRRTASRSSSRCSTRCWRSSLATRTPTTCAPRCSPRPGASRRRSRRARRPRSPVRRRASSPAGARGCSPAPDGARRRWPP